jgi:hypothetical protein
MQLPVLRTSNNSKEKLAVISAFSGVNKNIRIADGEFSNMHNMTNDYYPAFGNRKKRGIIDTFVNPMGVCGGDKLAYVDDNQLFYDFAKVMDLAETNEERQLVMMGAYLCVFPDGVVYNTVTREIQEIENINTTTAAITMAMCTLDGTSFDTSNTFVQSSEPTALPPDKIYWLDTSKPDSVILKMWSETYSMWTSYPTTYVKISSEGIGAGFKEYDSVKISGIRIKGYNDYDFNDNLIVYAADDDYIIVAGLMDLLYTQSAEFPVTVKRELPKLDFVCEYNNRIYGCRYGDNNDGEFVNEVYASKLGDPTNWFNFAGLAGDSYIASCGSQGEFTGIAAYGGYVFFFKEEGFHKLYGTQPANFQMIWRPCAGVAKGSSKSIAIVNEILFFKTRDGIVAYDGSENKVSERLDTEPYFDAVAAGYRDKYYISMRDQQYKYKLYVYDIRLGTWCIEDDFNAKYFVYADNATYLIDNDNTVYAINNEYIYIYNFPADTLYPSDDLFPGYINVAPYEDDIQWSFDTGDLGFENPYNKYVKRINLRMQLEISTKVRIEVEYDSSGDWEFVTEQYASKKKSYEIPIQVRRADHIRLRVSGWGEFRLFSITRAVEGGSGEDEGT